MMLRGGTAPLMYITYGPVILWVYWNSAQQSSNSVHSSSSHWQASLMKNLLQVKLFNAHCTVLVFSDWDPWSCVLGSREAFEAVDDLGATHHPRARINSTRLGHMSTEESKTLSPTALCIYTLYMEARKWFPRKHTFRQHLVTQRSVYIAEVFCRNSLWMCVLY